MIGQLRGAAGGVLDLAEHRRSRRLGGNLVLGEAGVAQNGREQVVEIVGDAAGQDAQALQLLAVQQLGLELLALLLALAAPQLIALGGNQGGAGVRQRLQRAHQLRVVPFGAVGDADYADEVRPIVNRQAESSSQGRMEARVVGDHRLPGSVDRGEEGLCCFLRRGVAEGARFQMGLALLVAQRLADEAEFAARDREKRVQHRGQRRRRIRVGDETRLDAAQGGQQLMAAAQGFRGERLRPWGFVVKSATVVVHANLRQAVRPEILGIPEMMKGKIIRRQRRSVRPLRDIQGAGATGCGAGAAARVCMRR